MANEMMKRGTMTWRSPMATARPFVVLGLVLLAASSSGSAQDEIEDPAGALPEGEHETATTDALDGPAVGDEAEKPATTKIDEAAKAAEEEEQANWESYEGAGKTGTEISKGVKIEDIVEPPADYHYAAFGKGDPFLPPMITEAETMVDPLEIPIVSPLQRYRLDELTLVGVWQLSSGERKAMVMVPANAAGSGQGIIVKGGDPIGIRGGRILSVGDDYLTVREFSLAPDGTRQYEDRQMFMGRRAPEDLAGKIRFEPGKPQTEVIVEDAKDAHALMDDGARRAGDAKKAADGAALPFGPDAAKIIEDAKKAAAAPVADAKKEEVKPAPKKEEPAKAPAVPEPAKDIGIVKF